MNIIIKEEKKNKIEPLKIFNIGEVFFDLQTLLNETSIEVEKNQIVILQVLNGSNMENYLLPLKYDNTSIYGFGAEILETDLIKVVSNVNDIYLQGDLVDNIEPFIFKIDKGYYLYEALISQSNEGNIIVESILKNDFQHETLFQRNNVGSYSVYNSLDFNNFDSKKITCEITNGVIIGTINNTNKPEVYVQRSTITQNEFLIFSFKNNVLSDNCIGVSSSKVYSKITIKAYR